MRGKRVSSTRYAARHLAAGRKSARRGSTSSAENRALWKLVICGVVFVVIVALKLLFPAAADSFFQSASQLLGRDADFKEAFAAMGRAASGEEDVGDSLQDAYTAVFNPSPMSASVTVNEPKRNEVLDEELSDTEWLPFSEESSSLPKTEEIVGVETSDHSMETENAAYSFVLPSLPENASLEQRTLGFSYTTPVRGSMTSSFGWREHPVAGDSRFHYGLDLAADTGTDICAFADGEVFATGESSTLGKYIILSHANGYKTLYAHCSTVVKHSGSVSMGEVIAKVGESGVATGPHLHFELQNGTLYLNPIYYVDLG